MKELCVFEREGNKLAIKHCFDSFDEIKKYPHLYNDILNRWDRLGYTKDLSDETKEMCSIAFEQIAALMLFSHHKFYEDYMEELIFPCIRRIVLEVGTKYSTRILYDSIYDVKLGKLFDKLLLESKWYYLIDLEAEIIVILSTALIKIMNGDAKITELYDLVKKQLDCELK